MGTVLGERWDAGTQSEYRWEAAHLAEDIQLMKTNLREYADIISGKKELAELKQM